MLQWLGRVAEPVTMAGIVLLFVILILLDRDDLRDRLLRLMGGNLHVATDALDEASQRIGKYLRMQFVVNITYGLPMAAGLWFIGVPGAILWGVLAAIMRFVPYVGAMISAAFPLALAFAVDPGWQMLLMTLGLIMALELISNNLIEPWLYGSSTGLSTLSIIVSATFWTALWGPIGLILSTPLTVCLLVLGRYIPALQFMEVLLGSSPVLGRPSACTSACWPTTWKTRSRWRMNWWTQGCRRAPRRTNARPQWPVSMTRWPSLHCAWPRSSTWNRPRPNTDCACPAAWMP